MQYILILTLTVLAASAPSEAFARHADRVDLDDLDDDVVEELPVPVLFGVVYDDITPDFGDPRGDGTRSHEGQDMRAPKGTPIVSPTEAIVLRTGTGESAGKYVYTANPGGEQFRYMHLDSIADIERGDELDVGDFIGTVGDTGNAPDGVYHLHFEIKDGREPTDPYPRLTETFGLEEKMEFLDTIFRDIRDDEEYAEFLVTTFRDDFAEALRHDYELPEEIEEALEDAGVIDTQSALERLHTVLATIPPLLQMELHEGDQGAAVALLQFYLIYNSDGTARDALRAVGATGYFGPLTAAAISEYQASHDVAITGAFDSRTREQMIEASNELGLAK